MEKLEERWLSSRSRGGLKEGLGKKKKTGRKGARKRAKKGLHHQMPFAGGGISLIKIRAEKQSFGGVRRKNGGEKLSIKKNPLPQREGAPAVGGGGGFVYVEGPLNLRQGKKDFGEKKCFRTKIGELHKGKCKNDLPKGGKN